MCRTVKPDHKWLSAFETHFDKQVSVLTRSTLDLDILYLDIRGLNGANVSCQLLNMLVGVQFYGLHGYTV